MINFMLNKTNDVAFVWEQRMAWVHVLVSDYTSTDGELPAMRLATEPLCKFFLYNSPPSGPLIGPFQIVDYHRLESLLVLPSNIPSTVLFLECLKVEFMISS